MPRVYLYHLMKAEDQFFPGECRELAKWSCNTGDICQYLWNFKNRQAELAPVF